MGKNICIIHFNTPVLTRCLVHSINKYTPGTNIYIFDNSDKSPFINFFDNVTVLDNTHGQIIDFKKELAKYPLRVKSRGKTNDYGSAKHAMSIQKCIEIIGDDFVLLDSDVLLKRDISQVWNKNYVWIAGVEDWLNKSIVGATKKKRVCPFLLYMNVEEMNKLGITFFDDTHMLGLNNGPKCEEYETGVWLYESTPKNKRRIINYNDYIYHFRAGSWLEDARTKQHYRQIDPLKWLERHKDAWLKPGESLPKDWKNVHVKEEYDYIRKKTNAASFNDAFDHIYCLHYLPDFERLESIKKEFDRIGIDSSSEKFSWVYDYPSPLLDLVYKDKRLVMDTSLKLTGRERLKNIAMKHYEIVRDAYSWGYDRILVMEDTLQFHRDLEYIGKMLENIPDTDVVMLDKMVSSNANQSTKYNSYISGLGSDALYGNMKDCGVFFIFSSCYALNRKAMERILKIQEEKLVPSDTVLNDRELSGSFAITNVAIRDQKAHRNNSESYARLHLDTSNYGTPVKAVSFPDKKWVKSTSRTTTGKKMIEPRKPLNMTKPAVKPFLPDKSKRTRTIFAKTTGHNKLYDVY